MYPIRKGTPPTLLVKEEQGYRDLPADRTHDVWQMLSADAKAQLKERLLENQRYVCCYCTSRIAAEKMRVEHFVSQKQEPTRRFDWTNLLAACSGNVGGAPHCDVSKGEKSVELDPQRPEHIAGLNYGIKGRYGCITKCAG